MPSNGPLNSLTRIILVGGRSFIAKHVREEAARRGHEPISLSHDEPLDSVICNSDVVVNFSLNPEYRDGIYAPDTDFDLRTALACRRVGASFVMLSTRRVYPAAERWDASESSPAGGDETGYGKNKARTEAAVRDTLGGKVTILRLSNIFGFEYDLTATRRTFFAQALTSLRNTGLIVLDIDARTRRDFLPVEKCASAIVTCAEQPKSDTFNIGCGFPVACGQVALSVVNGYGRGKVVATNDVRDEFFLNTEKWRSQFGALINEMELMQCCMTLGRRLQ